MLTCTTDNVILKLVHTLPIMLKIGMIILESNMEISRAIKMLIHFDPVISLLILYPKEVTQKNNKCYICMKILIATLSIIVPNRKQPKCSTIEELSKLWYINSTNYHAAISNIYENCVTWKNAYDKM